MPASWFGFHGKAAKTATMKVWSWLVERFGLVMDLVGHGLTRFGWTGGVQEIFVDSRVVVCVCARKWRTMIVILSPSFATWSCGMG